MSDETIPSRRTHLPMASLHRWLDGFAGTIEANREHLTQLDAAIGDADHGVNMARGMAAVMAAVDHDRPDSPGALFRATGMTLLSTVGGASGPLYGTFFLRMASSASWATDCLDESTFVKAVRAGVEGVVHRGRAELGDKTMFDALEPAAEALERCTAAGTGLDTALREAAIAATRGRDLTVPMVARKGRASFIGQRSVGHLDPGAASAALLVITAATGMTSGEGAVGA